jgi:ElaB/YqjD/DUF883 family membrane-anchored ribosome-binding protein
MSSGPPPQTYAPQTAESSAGLTERAGAAAEGAKDVVGEAAYQARSLVDEAKASVNIRSVEQRDRAAEGLRSLSSQFDRMAAQSNGYSSDNGTAGKVVNELARRSSAVADYLQERDPEQLLEEVRGYARRHPGVFIGVAAGLGLVIGRATRAMAGAASSTNHGGSSTVLGRRPAPSAQPVTPYGATDPAVAQTVTGTASSNAMGEDLDESFNGSMAGGRQ